MMQRTLGREITLSGPAVHTGTHNTVRLLPADADTGVVFVRTDLEGRPSIPALASNVSRTQRCTTIGQGEAAVSTIEHLMAALRGLGVDNVIVEIDGPEVPIADGSAALFCTRIREAGVVPLDVERHVHIVREPLWVRDKDKLLVALPYDGFKVSFTFTNDHRHPSLSDFFAEFDVDVTVFQEEIAPARTIGWLAELKLLQERGLALGAQQDMAIVLSPTELLTPLRFDDEPVRHKILDVIGDLYLAGYVHAHIVAIRTGHAHNNQLARAILAACQ